MSPSEIGVLTEEDLTVISRRLDEGLHIGDMAVHNLLATIAARDEEIARLREEIKVDDGLIESGRRLVKMFDCPAHGECIPYAEEQITEMRARVAQLETALREIEQGPFRDGSSPYTWEDMRIIARAALAVRERTP